MSKSKGWRVQILFLFTSDSWKSISYLQTSSKRNSKIPKGQTEIVKSEDGQDHGQQNETKDKHRTHNTTLKLKLEKHEPYKNQGEFRCSGRVSKYIEIWYVVWLSMRKTRVKKTNLQTTNHQQVNLRLSAMDLLVNWDWKFFEGIFMQFFYHTAKSWFGFFHLSYIVQDLLCYLYPQDWFCIIAFWNSCPIYN